ncbi:MAG: hypothetical protein B6241_15105 [Spirochaetaceae bacterium 4572_59]|nr:MAG: hypothetical protein B6241_15105 [Spirochaetaceae bacterium 4572_59]
MLSLVGILIILIGFIRKYNPIAVVLTAGIVTGLVSGIDIVRILDILGTTFVKTRYMSLFLITLPVIGLLERFGLRERAVTLIKSIKSVTSGRILIIYTFFRELAAAFSLRLGGHVQFIRPLVHPMAQGAAEKNFNEIDENEEDIIKGHSAAAENYANFFGQNVFPAAGGVLLVVGTLETFDITVIPLEVSKAALPVAVIAFVFAIIQNILLDRKLKKNHTKQTQKANA